MINRILSFFVSLATIVGIVIALFSYEAGQRQGRIDRAFEFYKDYRASALDADLKILSDKWNEKQEEASKFVPKDGGPVDEQGLLRLQTTLAQNANVEPALFRVVTFFDRLAQCIRAGLCDSDTSYALLRDPASLLVSSYGSYLIHIQQANSNTAHGIFIVNDLPAPSWSSFLRWWWQNPTGAAAPSQNQ